MAFKHFIMRTAAASGILLAASALAPASFLSAAFPPASAAQVKTNISVNFSFGTFYDRLQPYGSWVSYEDQYVFVPRHVSRTWRPYTLGHWSYTHRYGWLWVSNERFGWATYHYGRWGYARNIGWYWVPGHRWAPAWVVWSHGRNEIAWAPLPPRRGTNIDLNITIGDVPDYYWQAVPTSAFLSINLSDKIIRERTQVNTIVQQSPPETVRIQNNIVVNNVIQINEIEKATNAKVPVLVEKPVTNPDAVGKIAGNTVTIFNPVVAADTNAKPKQALKVEEVVTARKTQGIQPQDVPADQPSAAAPASNKNGKPVVATEPLAPKAKPLDLSPPKADAQGKVDSQGKVEVNKAKGNAPAVIEPPVAGTPVVKAPEAKSAPAPAPDIPKKPKNDKSPVAPPVDAGSTTTNAPVDKSHKKKDAGATEQKNLNENPPPPADAQTPPDDGKKAKGAAKKNGKGQTQCDPNIETCPSAQ